MGVLGSGSIAAAEGNSLSLAPAARASSLEREPLFVPPGQMGQGKEAFGRKDFPTTWISSVHGSLARELPAVVADTAKAEGVAFHTARFSLLQECFPYVGTAGLAATLRLRCGRRQLPQSRACGASQHAADAVAAAREPFGRMAGVAREGKTCGRSFFPDYMSLSLTGSLARELPAVVADTAKAEGVAFRRSATAVLQPYPKKLPPIHSATEKAATTPPYIPPPISLPQETPPQSPNPAFHTIPSPLFIHNIQESNPAPTPSFSAAFRGE